MYTERKDKDTGELESVVRQSDNAIIPPDPENVDYQEYLRWIASTKQGE